VLEVKVSNYDDPLTEAEFAAFRPNAEVIRYLEETRERLGLQRYEMNVLDWGSGRGEYVAWLRDAGYNAFGAEIRKEAAERGRKLLQSHGHDYARVIAPISANSETTLPADFFHFVFTHYVLEHVADIDAAPARSRASPRPADAAFMSIRASCARSSRTSSCPSSIGCRRTLAANG
jgi:2-polyprenyl-3-methyl-5-hydroxy-6-metoxy-1,4-benzoquinol methylase